MKLIEILKFAEEYLLKYSFSKPRLEAEKMIAYILKLDRLGLYTNFELEISQKEREEIKVYLKKMADSGDSFDKINKEPQINYKEKNMEFFIKSIEYLKEKGVADYKLDTEYIFAHVLNVSRTLLSIQLSKEISNEQLELIKKMLIQRGKYRKPLQQILGEWEFYGYPFKVNENVLIPRSDTENLVENCKHLLLDRENSNILDVGTGSGAIAITLGKELKNSKVTGLDISPEALEMAEENKVLNKAENVNFLLSDVFTALENSEEKYDLIVSNPPYIPLSEYNELMIEVKQYEPRGALTDGGDGYFFYEKISKESKPYLKDGGYLAFEVGYNQAEKVSEFMKENGFNGVTIIKDYCGIDRIVIGMKELKEI
ncbi:MAG: peptide chain release factor N(5)-glutamine methyltransferase [Fusobacteriaceae bacterium]